MDNAYAKQIITQNLLAQRDFVERIKNIDMNKLKFFKLGKEIWVPTLEIDLIWHAHMLDPKCYIDDCLYNFGYILNHDDKIRKDTLKTHSEKTQELWRKEYSAAMLPATLSYLSSKKDKSSCGGCSSIDTFSGECEDGSCGGDGGGGLT